MKDRMYLTGFLLFLVPLFVGGCEEKSPKKTASTSETAATEQAKPGGTLHVKSEFLGMVNSEIELGNAWFEEKDGGFILSFTAQANLKAKPCTALSTTDFNGFPGDVGLVLRSKNGKFAAKYSGKPGAVEHVGYTFFYPPEDGKVTNSGNGASEKAVTKVTFEVINDATVTGSFDLKLSDGTATGKFTAKRCSP